jgi:hypothetical protein
MRSRLLRRLCSAALLPALLTACNFWEAQRHPVDPPPNIAPGQELITVPDFMVEALSEPETAHVREAELQAVAEGRRSKVEPQNAEAVRAHRILTGMTVQEVVLSVGSHPTSIRDQGPPGGHTLLWEPPSFRATWRFWVRFDEWGKASAAGTN